LSMSLVVVNRPQQKKKGIDFAAASIVSTCSSCPLAFLAAVQNLRCQPRPPPVYRLHRSSKPHLVTLPRCKCLPSWLVLGELRRSSLCSSLSCKQQPTLISFPLSFRRSEEAPVEVKVEEGLPAAEDDEVRNKDSNKELLSSPRLRHSTYPWLHAGTRLWS
jgi:hypothetical protein